MSAVRPPRAIIGLVGPSGSGKSTVCKYLVANHHFEAFHIAGTLKAAFCTLYNVAALYCEQPLIDQPADFLGGVTPRTVLEGLGTCAHDLAPEGLPFVAERRARKMMRFEQRLLIDGIRRATEGVMVRRLGGKIIRMTGNSIDRDKPCDVSQIVVDHDFQLHWAPTLTDLYTQIDQIVRQIPGAVDAGA